MPLYCCSFLLLLPPFSVAAASFLMSSPSPSPSPSSSYLHNLFLVCCVLLVVVVVHRCVVSLLLLKILASADATLISPRHCLPTLLLSCSLVYLIAACIRDRFDGRSFSSINASQTFSRVIVAAVIIISSLPRRRRRWPPAALPLPSPSPAPSPAPSPSQSQLS